MAHDFSGAPVNNGILQQFDKQRLRGTEGFGLFDGQKMHIVRAAHEDKILKWLCKYDSNLIMFHHRNPTSTINVKQAAHPFSTKQYFGDNQYILVHNGVISNSDELFIAHQELGIEYQSLLKNMTFNDSESLLWEVALTLEGKQAEIKTRGSIAFICIKLHKGKLAQMYFGRNSSPLKLFKSEQGIALSSEGEGEMIDGQKLYTFDYQTKEVTSKDFRIPQYVSFSTYEWKPSTYREHRGRAGDWLPDNIKQNKKLKKYLSEQDSRFRDYAYDGTPIEYESDPKTQMLLPVGEPSWEDNLEPYQPMQAEVDALVMRYILGAQGSFEVAYWKAEDDYHQALDGSAETANDMRETLLMEAVLEAIETDPEYLDETSISNLWGTLWEQAALKA